MKKLSRLKSSTIFNPTGFDGSLFLDKIKDNKMEHIKLAHSKSALIISFPPNIPEELKHLKLASANETNSHINFHFTADKKGHSGKRRGNEIPIQFGKSNSYNRAILKDIPLFSKMPVVTATAAAAGTISLSVLKSQIKSPKNFNAKKRKITPFDESRLSEAIAILNEARTFYGDGFDLKQDENGYSIVIVKEYR